MWLCIFFYASKWKSFRCVWTTLYLLVINCNVWPNCVTNSPADQQPSMCMWRRDLLKWTVRVFMQGSEVRVNFVVMRAAETHEEGGSSREGQHSRAARRPEPQYFRRHSTYVKVLLKVVKPMLKAIISTLIWTLVVLVSVSYKYWMWLYTQCNSNDHSFESPTCTIHCQWKQTATHRFGEKRWEQTPALLRGDESPSPGPPSVLIKRPGCCSFCHYRPTVLLFLAVSLRGEDQSW